MRLRNMSLDDIGYAMIAAGALGVFALVFVVGYAVGRFTA